MASSKKKTRKKAATKGYTRESAGNTGLIMPGPKKEMADQDIVKYVMSCRDEAEGARLNRDRQDEENWLMFNLEYDFSHKIQGQSREIIDRASRTVDKTALFFQQALTDVSDWWEVKPRRKDGERLMKIKPHELYKLTNYHLDKMDHYSIVGKEVRMGLLNGVVITKITGRNLPKPRFVSSRNGSGKPQRESVQQWRLRHRIVQSRNYYPDPRPTDDEPLKYEIEDMWTDLSDVKQMAKRQPEVYNSDLINTLKPWTTSSSEEDRNKQIQTGQSIAYQSTYRARVKLTEFWGNIEDKAGNIIYENVVCLIANDKHLIMKPIPNPNWDQESPYVVTPLLESVDTRWPRAMMDAPVKHNKAIIEMWNLIVDGAMAAASNIKQLRAEWVSNARKFQKGIPNGATLLVNGSAPPNAKVMESIQTGNLPPEVVNVFNLIMQEYNASATDSDLRSGATPFRKVKATEIVEQSQAINSILIGIARNYEQKHLMKKLRKSWMLIAQRMDDFTDDEIADLLGESEAGRISGMTPQQRFIETVNGCKYEVTGITRTLKRAQDLQKLQTMLQVVGSSEMLSEPFVQTYDPAKTLEEILDAMGIRTHRIKRDEVEQQLNQAQQLAGQAQGQQLPDQMSQVPGVNAGPQTQQASLASALNQNLNL